MMIERIIFFLAPLLVANTIYHFIVVRYDLWSRLAKPIDLGKTIRGKRIFGDSKTFRGLVVIIPLTAFFAYIIHSFANIPLTNPVYIVGGFIGLGYMLGELPNSFAKRRLCIKESSAASGKLKNLFIITDHTDSILGALLFIYIIEPLSLELGFVLFISGVSLHIFINILLYRFGYKKNLSRL
jgi:hypothetical protein